MSSSISEISRLVPVLLPQLWRVWLECCPSEWTERRRHARSLLLVVRLLLQLFRPTKMDSKTQTTHQPVGLGLPWPVSFPADVHRHLLVHCPLRIRGDGAENSNNVPDASRADSETIESVLTAVDVAICELTLLTSQKMDAAKTTARVLWICKIASVCSFCN